MPDRKSADEVRTELRRNLEKRRRTAQGAWFPAGAAVAEPGTHAPAAAAPTAAAASGAPHPAEPPVTNLFGEVEEPVAVAPPPPARGEASAPSAAAPGAVPKGIARAAVAAPPPSERVFETQGAPRPESRAEREAELARLKEHSRACRRCRLCEQRTQAVFGVGDADARLMFVGEGPGRDEDAQGEPFVGRAGQKLTSLIEKLGLRREQVYIGNVVKCRPPDNRVPLPDEVGGCMPYLARQIELVRPKVIVCLGLTAAQALLDTKSTMGALRRERHRYGDILVIATYHPAYVLRNPKAAWDVWADVKDVPTLLA